MQYVFVEEAGGIMNVWFLRNRWRKELVIYLSQSSIKRRNSLIPPGFPFPKTQISASDFFVDLPPLPTTSCSCDRGTEVINVT